MFIQQKEKDGRGRRYTSSKINAYILVTSKGNDWTVI
jgi:hypothetical protein